MGKPRGIGQSTLRAHSEFQRVFKEGTRIFRNGLGFCVRKVDGIEFRYGISLPRRFGCAVERNQVRRRIREIIRNSPGLPVSAEIVFCISRPCCSLSFPLLKEACEWAFARVSRMKNNAEN